MKSVFYFGSVFSAALFALTPLAGVHALSVGVTTAFSGKTQKTIVLNTESFPAALTLTPGEFQVGDLVQLTYTGSQNPPTDVIVTATPVDFRYGGGAADNATNGSLFSPSANVQLNNGWQATFSYTPDLSVTLTGVTLNLFAFQNQSSSWQSNARKAQVRIEVLDAAGALLNPAAAWLLPDVTCPAWGGTGSVSLALETPVPLAAGQRFSLRIGCKRNSEASGAFFGIRTLVAGFRIATGEDEYTRQANGAWSEPLWSLDGTPGLPWQNSTEAAPVSALIDPAAVTDLAVDLPVAAKTVSVSGIGTLTLTGPGPIATPGLSLLTLAGTLTLHTPVAGNALLGESAVLEIPVAEGSPRLIDSSFTLSGGKGTLLKSGAGTLTLSGTNSIALLSLGEGTLALAGGTTEATRFVAGASGTHTALNQSGGMLTVTGGNSGADASSSMMLGNGLGSMTYAMTGGELRVPGASVKIGHTGTEVGWIIGNAAVSAQGIYAVAANTRPSAVTLNAGAAVTLGANGVKLNAPQTFTLNDGARLAFSAAASSTAPFILGGTQGTALIDPAGHPQTFAGFAGSGKAAIAPQSVPVRITLNGATTGSPTLAVGGNVVLQPSAGDTLGAANLDLAAGASIRFPFLPLTVMNYVTQQNWTTATGGTTTKVCDLSRIHTTGDFFNNDNGAVYSGQFYVPAQWAGQTWYFAGQYDDNIMLKVDGAQIFASAQWNATGTGSVAGMTEGWHTFEIRIRDATGNDGPFNADWKAARMAIGFRVGTAPADPNAAAGYTRFDADTLRLRASETPGGAAIALTPSIQGGLISGENIKLTRWRALLGEDPAVTAFHTTLPPDLDGATVALALTAEIPREGYLLGTFRNAGKATFTGLPGNARIVVADDGSIRIFQPKGTLINVY